MFTVWVRLPLRGFHWGRWGGRVQRPAFGICALKCSRTPRSFQEGHQTCPHGVQGRPSLWVQRGWAGHRAREERLSAGTWEELAQVTAGK